ncbi:MAG: hypothetical protein IJW05_12455 [Lentisphaeria bacterium]|nr:hypothetical protein [Lentisphaeria bacterium]
MPEDLIFKAYLQRAIDHLSLVYDPAYSLHISKLYGGGAESSIPERFRNGENVLEYAKNLLPQIGGRKNVEHLPFLIYFSAYSHDTIFDFSIPEGGETVTPENMGEVAYDRFPAIHGKSFGDIGDKDRFNNYNWHIYPLTNYRPPKLDGDVCRTASKSQMAYIFDRILDGCTAILLKDVPFYRVDEPDYWKKTDIYCRFCVEKYANDNLYSITDTGTTYPPDIFLSDFFTQGWIGWSDYDGYEIYKRSCKMKVEITSKSPFRYKFIVFTRTSEYFDDSYKQCKYKFADTNNVSMPISVLYESPDWITGDASWEYKFDPGPKPDWDTEKSWQITLYGTYVIIYPEYPDRLKELMEKEKI